jgi:hypothetical protein
MESKMSKSAKINETPETVETVAVETPKKVPTISVGIDQGQISFNVIGHDPLILDTTILDPAITTRAMFHGLVQKVSDAAALGKTATPSDKYHAMVAIVERLRSGDWAKQPGERKTPVSGLIFRAYTEVMQTLAATAGKSVTPEILHNLFHAKTLAEKRALRTNPDIQKVLNRLESEQGPQTVIDTSALLAELDI